MATGWLFPSSTSHVQQHQAAGRKLSRQVRLVGFVSCIITADVRQYCSDAGPLYRCHCANRLDLRRVDDVFQARFYGHILFRYIYIYIYIRQRVNDRHRHGSLISHVARICQVTARRCLQWPSGARRDQSSSESSPFLSVRLRSALVHRSDVFKAPPASRLTTATSYGTPYCTFYSFYISSERSRL